MYGKPIRNFTTTKMVVLVGAMLVAVALPGQACESRGHSQKASELDPGTL